MRCDASTSATSKTEYAPNDVAGEKDMASQLAASSMPVVRRFDFPDCGSPEIDAETKAAAECLRSGRLAYRALKRFFDIIFSLVVLVGLSWLYLIVAIAIKLDDPEGPVLFAQTRVGRDGREFRMWKFRSMYADAESRLESLMALNEKDGPVFKIADDPRITRVGRVIRKLSMAPVIIGTPGDGEPTKSLSHPENSSLDLQKCERRPGTSLGARHHYTSFQFLSFAVFGGPEGTSGRHLCAFARAPFAAVGTVA